MTFTFHYTQLTDCPNVKGWYYEFNPCNLEMIEKLHKAVSTKLLVRANADPHIKDNPIALGALYLNGLMKAVASNVTLLINPLGGFMKKDDSVQILKTVVLDKFAFPSVAPDSFELAGKQFPNIKEVITISRYTTGTHFYLSSNSNRIFIPSKYDTFKEAFDAALQFVPENQIVNKDRITANKFANKKHEGD